MASATIKRTPVYVAAGSCGKLDKLMLRLRLSVRLASPRLRIEDMVKS